LKFVPNVMTYHVGSHGLEPGAQIGVCSIINTTIASARWDAYDDLRIMADESETMFAC
jgi:hypothetical protein